MSCMILFLIGFFALTISIGSFVHCTSRHVYGYDDRLSAARVAWVSGCIFTVCIIWLLEAGHTWPYIDVVRTVEIHDGRAYLYKEKEDVSYITNTENELVPFEEEKYVNLNEYFGRQFQDGEKLKLRMYQPRYMWLSRAGLNSFGVLSGYVEDK